MRVRGVSEMLGERIPEAFKGEGLIKDDTKVTDMCGGRNCGAIDAEGEGFVE